MEATASPEVWIWYDRTMPPRRVALALGTLLALACGRGDVEPKPEWTPPFGPEFRTGFASCDAIIETYEECIDTKAPALARDDIKRGMQRSIAYWYKIVHQRDDIDGVVSPGLEGYCDSALMRWKRTAVAWGCDLPELRPTPSAGP